MQTGLAGHCWGIEYEQFSVDGKVVKPARTNQEKGSGNTHHSNSPKQGKTVTLAVSSTISISKTLVIPSSTTSSE